MQVAGIDGCRGGWLVILVQEDLLQMRLCPSIEDAADFCHLATAIWIDMPIGFTEDGPEGRECDRLARRILSPIRHSSVFTPPCRAALYADPIEASTVNYQRTGKKLSRQTVKIIPKMRELDVFLQGISPSLIPQWKEAHPEVVFAQLNNRQPMRHAKRRLEGRSERLHLLSKYWPKSLAWYQKNERQHARKSVQPDDIIDALGLAIGACLVVSGRMPQKSLPADPARDRQGFPMRIVCPNNG